MMYFQSGTGIARVGNNLFQVQNGALIIVPRGIISEVKNNCFDCLKFFITYSRPIFCPGQVQEEKTLGSQTNLSLNPTYTSYGIL